MAIVTGTNAKIQITSGASQNLSNPQAMTEMTGTYQDKRWYITDATKRLLDPTATFTVQVNRGSGYVTETTGFRILYGGGVVAWETAQTNITGVQFTAGKYFPFADWANGTGWTLNINTQFLDKSVLGKAWVDRMMSFGDSACSVKGWYLDDYFMTNMGGYVGVKLYEDTASNGTRWEALGLVRSDNINNPVDNIQDVTMELDIVGEPNYATYA